MDRLHGVLRSIRGEAKSAADHIKVFRDFVAHLETLQRRPPPPRKPRPVKAPSPPPKRPPR